MIKWVRFDRLVTNDYDYMSAYYYDAVVFVPRTDIYFVGFGQMANWDKMDIKLKFWW